MESLIRRALVGDHGPQGQAATRYAFKFPCDDVAAFVVNCRKAGMTCKDPTEEPWGLSTDLTTREGRLVCVYELKTT